MAQKCYVLPPSYFDAPRRPTVGIDSLLSHRLLTKSGVGVEKLAVQKFAEIALRQDAHKQLSLFG